VERYPIASPAVLDVQGGTGKDGRLACTGLSGDYQWQPLPGVGAQPIMHDGESRLAAPEQVTPPGRALLARCPLCEMRPRILPGE
jgi:hypothetical protein